MRKHQSLIFILVATLVFAVCYHKVTAKESRTGAPAGIAVVCIPDVISQSKYVDSVQADVRKQRDEKVAFLEKMQADLKAIQADVETRKPGSDDYNKLKKDYMLKDAELKVQSDMLQEELMGLQQKAMEKVYEKILAIVADIAKTDGYELVLDRDKVDFPAGSPNEMTLTIQTHKVLYSADYMDITEQIITALDKNKK